MVELHAHLLPGIDDGPRTMEDAIDLVRAFVADGVRGVVVTPHVFPGRFDNLRGGIERAVEAFRAVVADLGLPLSLRAGGEVRVSEDLPRLLESGELPFVGDLEGRSVLLLEMPDDQIPVGMGKLLDWLSHRRVQVLIAHPERNRGIRRDPARAESMVREGVLLQITAGALLGDFGPQVEGIARRLLERECVAVVASDAHGARRRPPRLGDCRRWLQAHYGEVVAERLTSGNPARLAGFGHLLTEAQIR